MQALSLLRSNLTVEEIDDPTPERRQLLARPLACGICGSDLHTVDSADELIGLHRQVAADAPHSPLRGPAVDPEVAVVLGHEFSAEVVGIGSDVDDFVVGDRVVSVPRLIDVGGKKHTIGYSASYPGGFAELMLIDADLALRFDHNLEPSVAALTEPLAVALHAVNRARLEPGQPTVVVGCGPVGLAIILQLRAVGNDRIVAADPSPSRRALAETVGARLAVDPEAESPSAVAMGLGSLPPVIFEVVGAPGVLDQVLLDAPAHSHVVVVGACLQPDHWRPMLALGRELTISFALAYSDAEFAETLRALEEARLDPRPLITSIVPLDQAPTVFEMLREPGPSAKILIGGS